MNANFLHKLKFQAKHCKKGQQIIRHVKQFSFEPSRHYKKWPESHFKLKQNKKLILNSKIIYKYQKRHAQHSTSFSDFFPSPEVDKGIGVINGILGINSASILAFIEFTEPNFLM